MEASDADREASGTNLRPMFQVERRQRIMDRVLQVGRVDVTELAERFTVTNETIRRDLTQLQRERLVLRVHGGAVPFRDTMITEPLQVREGQHAEEKRRIARAAALEVPEGGSVLIDAGSTTAHLAEFIDRDRDLTVITNSIPIVRALATTEHPHVIVLGGALRRRTMAFVDETGIDTLGDYTVDVLFMGCDGASVENGFSVPYRSEAAIKRAMISSARRTVMMFDHSKLGDDRLLRFAALSDIDTIVTGVEVDEATAAKFEEHGPVVVRA